jgi:uncharacterized repeat protein (TIGR03803 family)
MLISDRLRHLVALSSLALVCLAIQAPAHAARTEESNLIGAVAAGTITDKPVATRSDLLLANDGNIYFVSASGGKRYGAVGKLAPDGTLTAHYAFNADASESVSTFAGLIQASDGNLYGTSFLGGSEGGGTVFRVTLGGTYTLLRSLGVSATDAALPYAGVTQGPDGRLYGTTMRGGLNDNGTIFRINLDGTDFAIIHQFDGSNGDHPQGRLIVGANGELYGTTLQGGSGNRGTIYRISTAGVFTQVYSFPSLSAFNTGGIAINTTGANPRSALLLAADGNYYGTAYQGGPGGYGTVYRMTPAGVVSVFHGFTGPSHDGGFPLAGLIQDPAGNFYGTTERGGYLDLGSAYRLDAGGTQFSLLHGFVDSSADGSTPYGGLLLANNFIYGVSYSDSLLGQGVIFKLDTGIDTGTGRALPVELSVSTAEIVRGSSATLTWSSASAATCTAAGSWTNGATTTSGTLTVTPTAPGIYTYVLSCTDGAGVLRNAYTTLTVNAPPLETVDGGGGTGSMSMLLLLLLAALLFRKNLKEI